MSAAAEALLKGHNYLHSVSKVQKSLVKNANPLRLGVLSAAAINPTSIFDPVSTHSDVIIAGLAARSSDKARAQIEKYNLQNTAKVYDTYDDLIKSSDVEAVYISLPNSLHAEWTIRALENGKHVLVEKPIASNASEVRSIIEVARKARKVVLEAYHWRFHPASQLVKSLVNDTETYGELEAVKARCCLPAGSFPENDIRLRYDLAGGSCMDLCYVFSATSYYASGGDAAIISKAQINVSSAVAHTSERDRNIDEHILAEYSINLPSRAPATSTATATTQNPIKCYIEAALTTPKFLGVVPKWWDAFPMTTIDTTKARIEFSQFMLPWLYHNITIREKDIESGRLTGKKTTKKLYVGGQGSDWARARQTSEEGEDRAKAIGERWWTSYRYQLEAFVRQVRQMDAEEDADVSKNNISIPWVALEESEKVMEIIDAVYEKAGLPKRGPTP